MAFKEDEPVRMIFKTVASSHGMQIPNLSEYKNIEVINEVYTAQELNDLLKRGDCFVYPSRGEGFGIPPLEAMATGIPVITPNQHAITEYFDPEFMIDVKTELIPAQYDHLKGDLGNFVKCDVEDLAKALRFAYENKDKYRSKSGDISKYALNYSMKKATQKLVKILGSL
jgi:glycosyltransferase involved in cell wall biosynthesis